MIVKIWPIKADYANDPGKVGGTEGLENSLDYISDPEKIIDRHDNFREAVLKNNSSLHEDVNGFINGNPGKVITYMSNQDKIENKYMSGYLCDAETALFEFEHARSLTLSFGRQSREKETGAIAFHIVQSFPKDLDISSDEVHQCGIELCEKINLHQAVICSHVHPLLDEDTGKLHGACKHNHILINAYIHPDKFNPKTPGRLKYHDCKESYAQLRVWNDEIAIEHGLPIIRNPDDERTYSWFESDAVNKGLSWKERIRLDIDGARKASTNWEEFVDLMEHGGYRIKEGAHVSYVTPDESYTVRGKTLGREYTKESLELYWSISNYMKRAVEETLEENSESQLSEFFAASNDNNFTVGIPIGPSRFSKESVYYLPLNKSTINNEAVETYFNDEELYDIFDEDKQKVAAISGADLINYLGTHRTYEIENEKNPLKKQERKKKYYTNPNFKNSKTGSYYRTNIFDENGQRRSLLELIFILAMTILKKEDGLWVGNDLSARFDDNPIHISTDYKIQKMIDSMYLAEEEKIETPAELDRRLNEAGASLSRARSALKKTTTAKSKMEVLNGAVMQYRATQGLIEQINNMPEGPEKKKMQLKYESAIEKYKKAKALMYQYNVTKEDQIKEFEQKYEQIGKDIQTLEERFANEKETYRKLKQISYGVALAQNPQFCYGPEYIPEQNQQNQKKPEEVQETMEKEISSYEKEVEK